MRSSNAVSLPVAAALTGLVPAPTSGSIPVVPLVLVVGDDEAGTDETPVGGDDVLDPPHPETASNATVATTMETSLRMSAAY
jgi:hypothetical protein